MKVSIKLFSLLVTYFVFTACNQSQSDANDDHTHDSNSEQNHDHGEHHEDILELSEAKFNGLNIVLDTLPKRNMARFVEAKGRLEVPPQNEASVTAIVGANISEIKVIEGDKVSKNQTLASISHPQLIQMQSDYIQLFQEFTFLEEDYKRQESLYNQNASSGKNFQKVKSEYLSVKAQVKGLELQLIQLNIDVESLQKGEISEKILVKSPIDGYVKKVHIKIGQYIDPQTIMMEIVNIDHIHADLMVFEKDVHLVRENQKIKFTVESAPNKEFDAVIYSVGKTFEDAPKAVHIHAEIMNKEGLLIPGMYVNGQILTQEHSTIAVPEEAVVLEGNKNYLFKGKLNSTTKMWEFSAVEVIVKLKSAGWLEIALLEDVQPNEKFALNNSYYLLTEMKKEEAEHNH